MVLLFDGENRFSASFLFCMACCALPTVRQAMTLDGSVVVDLRRAGGLEDSDWWLAIDVPAQKIFYLLRESQRDEILQLPSMGQHDPPAYLRQLTHKLEAKAASTSE